jgi:hypothetical protein
MRSACRCVLVLGLYHLEALPLRAAGVLMLKCPEACCQGFCVHRQYLLECQCQAAAYLTCCEPRAAAGLSCQAEAAAAVLYRPCHFVHRTAPGLQSCRSRWCRALLQQALLQQRLVAQAAGCMYVARTQHSSCIVPCAAAVAPSAVSRPVRGCAAALCALTIAVSMARLDHTVPTL